MKCELCCENTKDDILAIFKNCEMQVCKDCANALAVNYKVFQVSLIEPMPKR